MLAVENYKFTHADIRAIKICSILISPHTKQANTKHLQKTFITTIHIYVTHSIYCTTFAWSAPYAQPVLWTATYYVSFLYARPSPVQDRKSRRKGRRNFNFCGNIPSSTASATDNTFSDTSRNVPISWAE